jgi:hypothetical protein
MTSSETVSLHVLRRYHFGELSAEERSRVERALEEDPASRSRLERMRAEEAAFLDEVDLARESVAILEQLDRPERPRLAWWASRPLQLAAAFVLLVALVPLGRAFLSDPPRNREKGSATLEMFVKDAAGVREGTEGMRLREGDQVQFRYRALGRRYLFVVSVDGRGVISPLYPDSETTSIEVRPDGLHTLEGSVILDDAVGPERFLAVFSDRPLSYQAIEEAVAKREGDLGRLRPRDFRAEDVELESILIIKE